MLGFGHQSDYPEAAKAIRSLIGPGQVDQQIRQAIIWMWVILPEKDKKNADRLEQCIRETVDRALRDFRDDLQRFTENDDDAKARIE